MTTTILRFAKIKSKANIRQAGAHQHRHHKDTPNANPRLEVMNRYFHGSSNLIADVETRLSLLEKEPRKNAVLAVEGLLSLSPEAFKNEDGTNDIDVLTKWFNQSRKWLKNEFGDNLVNAVLHRDEQTPHIHFVFVPLVEKEGKRSLSARDTLTKETLRGFQKSYYDTISDGVDGLEPPRHGSKRKHTEIAEFYTIMDKIKDDAVIAVNAHVEGLKSSAERFMKDKYLPLLEGAIERAERELEGRLTQEVKQKLWAQFDVELQKEIGNAFQSNNSELNAFADSIGDKVAKAKIQFGDGATPDQTFSQNVASSPSSTRKMRI